jgi:hypothetical protein
MTQKPTFARGLTLKLKISWLAVLFLIDVMYVQDQIDFSLN